jgi:type IV pilus assembly protein PilP
MSLLRPFHLRPLCVASLALVLVACGHDMTDLTTYVQEVKARKSKDIDPIPQIKPYEAFAYVEAGRRQPFTPIEQQRDPAKDAQSNNPDATAPPEAVQRNREPLEEFPLDGLRMMGVIKINSKVFALVKAPDNVIHRVAMGNYLGQNYGKIVGINDTEINLSEVVSDGFGGWVKRTAVLAITE